MLGCDGHVSFGRANSITRVANASMDSVLNVMFCDREMRSIVTTDRLRLMQRFYSEVQGYLLSNAFCTTRLY